MQLAFSCIMWSDMQDEACGGSPCIMEMDIRLFATGDMDLTNKSKHFTKLLSMQHLLFKSTSTDELNNQKNHQQKLNLDSFLCMFALSDGQVTFKSLNQVKAFHKAAS